MDRQSLGRVLDIPDLPLQLKRVDSEMEKIIGRSSLGDSARQLIEAGGKRLRPALVIAGARLAHPKTGERTIAAAAAIELLHLASLVHDDVIDNASHRRGIRALNVTTGAGHSILVGDFLIVKAIGTATALDQRLGLILSDTLTQMTLGVSAEPSQTYKQLGKEYVDIVRKKTASLMSAACQVGGICGGLTAGQIMILGEFGERFGIAFQIIDDMQDGDIKKTSIDAAVSLIEKNNREAARSLGKLNSNKVGKGLANLPDFYLDWALKNSAKTAIV